MSEVLMSPFTKWKNELKGIHQPLMLKCLKKELNKIK